MKGVFWRLGGDLLHPKSERIHVCSRDVVVIRLIKEESGNHSPFRERPVGGRGGGGGEAGVRREQEEDVLREEERVGRAEDDVLSSTREEDLRRSQVSAEEWDLWERPRLFNCETDALDAQL